MEKDFTKFDGLECIGTIPLKDKNNKYIRSITYTLLSGKDCRTYTCPSLEHRSLRQSVILEGRDFINGFKVIRFNNGEFGYMKEDGAVMPHHYDIAGNFNEYGFALVGKNGSVSWIDRTFRYFGKFGKMEVEDLSDDRSFDGFEVAHRFSPTTMPLSKVYDDKRQGLLYYLNTEGRPQKFYFYDGQIDTTQGCNIFSQGTDFTESGFATADDKVLLERGYFCSNEYIDKLMKHDNPGKVIEMLPRIKK